MHEELERLDRELAALACSLREGEHSLAHVWLGELALRLDHYIRREERGVTEAYQSAEHGAPRVLAVMRREHQRLREIITAIASSLDSADRARAIDLLGKLRSVLLLHIAKEESLMPSQASGVVH